MLQGKTRAAQTMCAVFSEETRAKWFAAFGINLLLVQRVRRDTQGERRFLDAKHPELHREVFELPGPIGQAREAVSSSSAHNGK